MGSSEFGGREESGIPSIFLESASVVSKWTQKHWSWLTSAEVTQMMVFCKGIHLSSVIIPICPEIYLWLIVVHWFLISRVSTCFSLYKLSSKIKTPLLPTCEVCHWAMIKNLCWLVRGGEKTTNYNHIYIYSHTSWAPSRVITRSYSFGCFFKWWYPQNTPKWSFLVGKPWLLGTIILGNSHLLWGPHFTPFTTIDPRPTLQSSFSMDFSVPLCYFSTEVVVYPCMSLKNAMALPVLRSHRSGAFWGINDEQQRKYRSLWLVGLIAWRSMLEYHWL